MTVNRHPRVPVILVHGTAENMSDNWQAMSPALKAAGYCVYAFNYASYNGSGAIGVLRDRADRTQCAGACDRGRRGPVPDRCEQGGSGRAQQAAGSSFITQLNASDETPGAVDYTNIVTRYDEVVTPYTSGFLAADGNAVTNVTLQDRCPNDTSEHLRTPYDPPAIQITLNALGRSGPADPAFQPACAAL